MNTKHTPSPWVAADGCCITADDGRYCIANIEEDGGYETPPEEQRANARLIAASPTMHAYIQKRAEGGCGEAKSILDALL